ncbi:MAG TPA: hypothetical protein VJX67_15270, partial [Blastocatellia bacterium]|nr:hypothetical protein [Blastocatellia bacterium]
AEVWLAYIALEPYLRQRWPHRIVAWSRLLAGRLRDPLVGRDILIGAVFAVVLTDFTHLRVLLPTLSGRPVAGLWAPKFDGLLGFRRLLGVFLDGQLIGITVGLGAMFLLLLFYIALRREWLAAAVFGVLVLVVNGLGNGGDSLSAWLSAAVTTAAVLVVLKRFGLVAYVVFEFLVQVLASCPLSWDFRIWYAGNTEAALLIFTGLVVYAFYTALGGRPVFRNQVAQQPA